MGGANFMTLGAVPDPVNDKVTIAPINSTNAAATIVAGVAGKRITVHGMHLVVTTAQAITVQDVGASTTVAQSGPMVLAAGVPLVLPFQNYPWYTVAPGDSLVISNPSAAQLSGAIIYVQG